MTARKVFVQDADTFLCATLDIRSSELREKRSRKRTFVGDFEKIARVGGRRCGLFPVGVGLFPL